jgi:hypothetical protein
VNELHGEAGLVGKMIVVWLLFLALLAVAAIDAASIAFTTYKLSDAGSSAASEGALVFKRTRDVRDACERVSKVLTKEDPAAKLTPGGCKIERPTGLVTVSIRKRASTLITHRIPWTQDLAVVVVKETAGAPSL